MTTGEIAQVCSICNETLSSEPLPLASHTPVLRELWPAYCLSEGMSIKECSACAETLETVIIEPFGHSLMERIVLEDAGCLISGRKIQRCAVCDAVITVEEIPAAGHAWSEWVTDIEATKEHEGRMSRFCTHCG